MYRVTIKDGNYNALNFEFESMEEVTVFAETVLHASTGEIEVDIKEAKKNA